MRYCSIWLLPVAICWGWGLGFSSLFGQPPVPADRRQKAREDLQQGNFRDAYRVFQALVTDPETAPTELRGDLQGAIQAATQLGDLKELDALLECAAQRHEGQWRLLAVIAESWGSIPHSGFVIAGEFQRGHHRGGGEFRSAEGRDRGRALQLFDRARELSKGDPDRAGVGRMLLSYAQTLVARAGGTAAWKLQLLTDLVSLPDYEVAVGFHRGWMSQANTLGGAPVTRDGKPVYHALPANWGAAVSDGERWRWLLTEAARLDPTAQTEVELTWAMFLQEQFGVQTLASGGFRPLPVVPDQGEDPPAEEPFTSGPFALASLGDQETLARLANGVRRWELPDDYNYVRLLKRLAEREPTARDAFTQRARENLCREYEFRRQFPRAAEQWKLAIAEYGPGVNDHRQKSLAQITGNWGQFEAGKVQAAGPGTTLRYRFRNGRRVDFEARPIDVARMLQQVKLYLKGRPKDLDWQQLSLQDLGYRVVTQEGTELLGAPVANWSLDLAPTDGHVDQEVTVATPLQKAGAYLVTGRLADGNVSRIVVWLADLALVKKPLENRQWYYVADARTGAPVEDEKVTVEFFGWQAVQAAPNQPGFQVVTQNKAFFASTRGDVALGEKDLPAQLQWLAIATTPKGRLAYLGFSGLWFAPSQDPTFDQVRALSLTDRPVYRPAQRVHFKFWVQRARYDQPDIAEFAKRPFEVVLRDPRGNEALRQNLTADEFGGVAGEHELPGGAPLGLWHLQILAETGQPVGDGFFRVEEYKKPEYEVAIDAPTKPVRLGEPIEAKIRARYLVGGGVAGAHVRYKVIRTASEQAFYPPGPWDWLYGPGYGCLSSEATWYPGYREWGASRPAPPWWPRPVPIPEVVLDGEAVLDGQGELVVPIETSDAKEQHGKSDHRYQITAEVTDGSRRTIVGEGSVLAARNPFDVHAWLDRGFYDTGDTINARVMARTPAGVPVEGRGELTLLRVTYVATEPLPREEPVRSWELETRENGMAEQRIAASEPGQYRLRFRLTDTTGTSREGAVLFVVRGEKFDAREFRFNDLELLTDQREYSVGQKVRLMINTNRVNASVLLFVRAANGICPPPRLIRVQGKSTVEEIEIVPGDMPNFFVEALTISQGQVHTVVREVFVPPEKRVLNVEVKAEATELRPGERANLHVRLTDLAGRPFVGSTVISVYDRALDLISGDQAIPDIRSFFWNHRRSHQPQLESSLSGRFGNLLRPGEEEMRRLGLSEEGLISLHGVVEMTAGAAGGMGGVAAAPMMADGAPMARGMAAPAMAVAAAPNAAALAAPVVRKQFADLAYWTAALTTDADGTARVEFPMPENLTGWKVRVWGLGRGTRVGEGATELVTRKQLMLRLQAPRFFVEKDEVVLSAIIRNDLPEAKQVQVSLETVGETLDKAVEPVRQVIIPAGGEQRVDWRVAVLREGQATVRMLAQADIDSDGMEQTFPVLIHGAPQQQAASGVLRPQAEVAQVRLRVPAERRVNDSRLEVRVSPTLAGAMVDALPFLSSYPHGCTEQTLNRFLPTVVTRNILREMGMDLEQIGRKRANLNPQELGDPKIRALDWQRSLRNPVYDAAEVSGMVESGVQALTDMQLSDGGWGWFSGFGEVSSPHTTAVVVHGLQQAARHDVALVPRILDRGVDWLNRHQRRQIELLVEGENEQTKKPNKRSADDLDALVFLVLSDADRVNPKMREYLLRDRVQLSVYAKALLGLALHAQRQNAELAEVLKNIEQFLVEDAENQTAWLQLPEGTAWWYWHGSELEANAWYLKLLSRTDPQSDKTAGLVKYLLNNRRHGAYWNSTRDTAYAIEALSDYLRASGENRPSQTIEIWFDGQPVKSIEVTPENLFDIDNSWGLQGDAVEAGDHTVEIKRRGGGPVYFNAYLSTFTLEDQIGKAGLELRVSRQYYKLTDPAAKTAVAGDRGQVVEQRVVNYERTKLQDLDELVSGDLVEVELEIDSKNDYEYLLFSDPKGAGFEPVELRSGYLGNPLGAYTEFRDQEVQFYIRQLPRGKHSVSYRMRAEIPGRFSALPTQASAMYAPELRGNSDEVRFKIVDRP